MSGDDIKHQDSKDICLCQSFVFMIFRRRRWWLCFICFNIKHKIKLSMVMVSSAFQKHVVMENFIILSRAFVSPGVDLEVLRCAVRKWTSSTSCIKHNRNHKPSLQFTCIILNHSPSFFCHQNQYFLFRPTPTNNTQKQSKEEIKKSSEKL